MRKIFSFLLILFSLAAPAFGAEKPIDIVFDIDFTLLYPTTEALRAAVPENTLSPDGTPARLTDHTAEVIARLSAIPNVRISFFSGGLKPRNERVVKEIYRQVRQLTGRADLAPYLVLNKRELKIISRDPSKRFWERFKKDLAPYFDLDSVVLVDDIKEFIPDNELASMLWLGKTYNDRPRFDLQSLEDPAKAKYSAPSFEEWRREREKLVRAVGILVEATERARNSANFVQAFQSVLADEAKGSFKSEARGRRELGIRAIPRTCHALFAS